MDKKSGRSQRRRLRYSTDTKSSRPSPLELKNRFEATVKNLYFVRVHMTLMLVIVLLSGIITSKLLLELGVKSMFLRYPLTVVAAWLMFFVLIRIWIWYVSSVRSRFVDDISFDVDLSSADFSGGGDGGEESFNFGGGSSGGGGASDSWGEEVASETGSTFSSSADYIAPRDLSTQSFSSSGSSSGNSSGWFDFDFSLDFGDEGCGAILIPLLILLLLLLGIFGTGIWLVYAAPAILPEAAFEAILAVSLWKATKQMWRLGWVGSIFKSTLLPFLLTVAIAAGSGWALSSYCPDAVKIADVFQKCQSRNQTEVIESK